MTEFPATRATHTTLDNGLTVIIDDQVSAPVVSCQIWVETGSMHEFPQLGSGISHLLEHMVFKGTEKYSRTELADTVQAAGGQWNAYTSFDRTVYYIDGPAESADTFLDVLCEMVFRPTFPESDFELERDVIRREIDMGLDSPDSQGSQLLFSTAYQRDGRRHPVIGHLDLFNALSHADMCDYHRRRYSPQNAFVVIAGKVDADSILATLKEITPPSRGSFDDRPIVPQEPQQLGKRVARKRFAVPISHLTLAWQVPGLNHDDASALDLLATILGSGRSSILYRELRENRQLCHHIGAFSWLPPEGPGIFAISAEVDHEGRDALQQAISDQLTTAQASPLQDALERARRMTLSSQFRTLTTASGRASDLASNWHEARNLDFTRDYITSLNGVTVADIRRVAAKYLRDRSLSIVSLDPEDSSETPAAKSAKVIRGDAVQMHQLSNGLTIVLGHDDGLPMVNFCLTSLAGLPAETAENAGVGALLSAVMDKGSRDATAEEIATQLDDLGARLSFSSGNNTFLSKLECLSEDVGALLPLFAEMVIHPTLPDDAIAREKDALLAAIAAGKEKPLAEAMRRGRAALFTNRGYGLPNYGTEASVAGLDRLSLSAHHSLHLRAKNSCLAVFGAFDPATILPLLESAFGAWESGKKFAPPASSISAGSSLQHTLDKKQAALVMAYPTAGIKSTDEAAVELLQAYTSDMSGPIFGRIREELGLAYSASTQLWHGVDAGMYSFYLATAPEQMQLAETELLKEIALIAENGIPEEKFGALLNSLLAEKELQNQANSARAMLSAVDTILGFAPDRFLKRAIAIKSLTPADVQRAASHILSVEPTISRVQP